MYFMDFIRMVIGVVDSLYGYRRFWSWNMIKYVEIIMFNFFIMFFINVFV